MINRQLLNPDSIVVIGGSDDLSKPGGKILRNLISGGYEGKLYVSNPKSETVQGIRSYTDIYGLPDCDLAILAVPAKICVDAVKILSEQKNTKAFIIISAGFSESSKEGAELEHQIVEMINKVNGVLIGPNGIGVLTPNYSGIFTCPVPVLDPKGVDFITGSGATAVFIMELGIPNGLRFASMFSVGNSAQTGVEEILEYMDVNYVPGESPNVKILYLEQINKPDKLLKHARSLISKGCKIAAVKAGSSDAGSRAASSHTGALASNDVAVDALFNKAGIVRCNGRQELITMASVFMYPELKGKNLAIITHAGGPAVMLTDALEKGGLNIPKIENPKAQELLEKLYPGSSVANPIDFLATGTADQLSTIIDYCENEFNEIDAMVVIFGTPGLQKVYDAYNVIDQKLKKCKKPIYPVLPSINEAKDEISDFISKGRAFFHEEVLLGNALSKIYYTPKPKSANDQFPYIDLPAIRNVIDNNTSGYLSPNNVQLLLDAAGIHRAKEVVAETIEEAKSMIKELSFPVVMKVVGPVHKSDVGGVVLNVKNEEQLTSEFNRMIKIKDTVAVLMQPMLNGMELFVGAKYENKFGHIILAGLGGIFIEVLKDVTAVLSPVDKDDALKMIKSLKSYKLIEGTRGQKGINQEQFADTIVRLGALLNAAPEIMELDLNPLLGTPENVIAVDARIKIQR
jgi:acetyltransferase